MLRDRGDDLNEELIIRSATGIRNTVVWKKRAIERRAVVLGVFSEFERSLIRERVMAGLERAKSQGKSLGRPRIDANIEAQIRELLTQKGRGIRRIAKDLGVGTGTVQRIKAGLSITG